MQSASAPQSLWVRIDPLLLHRQAVTKSCYFLSNSLKCDPSVSTFPTLILASRQKQGQKRRGSFLKHFSYKTISLKIFCWFCFWCFSKDTFHRLTLGYSFIKPSESDGINMPGLPGSTEHPYYLLNPFAPS